MYVGVGTLGGGTMAGGLGGARWLVGTLGYDTGPASGLGREGALGAGVRFGHWG